jgi:hypothetical protein
MFNKKQNKIVEVETIQGLKNKISELELKHRLEISELDGDNKLSIKEKEFELKHFKDEEILKLNSELAGERQQNAVLKMQNEMLVKITDLNADIIDIKDLVNKLVDKLPTINLSSLTVQQNGTDKR